MFRKLIIIVLPILVVGAICFVCLSGGLNLKNNDQQQIRQASLDYIEGWYQGDDLRMGRALHPSLVKRYVSSHDSNSVLEELGWSDMVNMTKNGGGKNVPKDRYKIKLTILDMQDNIASVKAESEYIDYLHLVKFNNRWVIINVLWDYNNRK